LAAVRRRLLFDAAPSIPPLAGIPLLAWRCQLRRKSDAHCLTGRGLDCAVCSALLTHGAEPGSLWSSAAGLFESAAADD